MEIKFFKPAELDDATTYYETELFGLGELFQNEILRAIKRIKGCQESYQQFWNYLVWRRFRVFLQTH